MEQALLGGQKCRQGKTGLNKIYFYTEDRPEPCVASGATRYEVYLPFDWKDLIYDLYLDPRGFRLQAKQEIEVKQGRPAYPYETREYVEQLIYHNGFKGVNNSNPENPLQHAIILFYALSTIKPCGSYVAYDWSLKIIETASEILDKPVYRHDANEEIDDLNKQDWITDDPDPLFTKQALQKKIANYQVGFFDKSAISAVPPDLDQSKMLV